MSLLSIQAKKKLVSFIFEEFLASAPIDMKACTAFVVYQILYSSQFDLLTQRKYIEL